MNILNKIIIGALLAFGGAFAYQTHQLKKYKDAYEYEATRTAYYEQKNSDQEKNNRILQLKVKDLEYSLDTTVLRINNLLKDKKIKPKNVKLVSLASVVLDRKDTVIIKEPNQIDFKLEINKNPLTRIMISRVDSLLYHELYISTTITIIYIEEKEYVNKYRNGWLRFWHFDWKRRRARKFEVDLDNEDIKVIEVNVIEIID